MKITVNQPFLSAFTNPEWGYVLQERQDVCDVVSVFRVNVVIVSLR